MQPIQVYVTNIQDDGGESGIGEEVRHEEGVPRDLLISDGAGRGRRKPEAYRNGK